MQKNIKLNITAVYTAKQTGRILKRINKKTKSIISIFAGRMADKGKDPLPIFKKSISLTKKNKNIEILWASTREVLNIVQANNIGCHIITVPHQILSKLPSLGKNLEKLSLETVQGFLSDAKKANYKIETNNK